MKKLFYKLMNKKTIKYAPYVLVTALSVSPVMCSTLFNGVEKLLNTVGGYITAGFGTIATLAIIGYGAMCIFKGHDEKQLARWKNALLNVFKVTIIITLAPVLLRGINAMLADAFGSGQVLETKDPTFIN